MKFNDLTLKFYTFFKVRDSLVLFLIGLALLTTGMHEISLSQDGLNIPRGAPPLDEIPERGAPGLDANRGLGAPVSNHTIGSGGAPGGVNLAPATQGSPSALIQGRPDIFIQGTPDRFIQGRPLRATDTNIGGDFIANRFDPLLQNTFDTFIEGTNDQFLEARNTEFIEGRPGDLINGTPDRFIDGRLADQSNFTGAEDLLNNVGAEATTGLGIAEQPIEGATLVAQQADIPFDDDLIRFSVGNLFKFIEGAFGALLVVGAGIGAIIAATVGAYKMALGLLVTSVGAFILRAYVSLFFGTDYPDFDSVNLGDF